MVPLLITTDSVADLPQSLVTGLKIPVFPYRVHMDGGVFADKLEVSGDVMIRYIEDKKTDARSEAPEPADYEGFFAEQLSHAQHIIHIALAKNASKGYAHATEAARSFYNVKVHVVIEVFELCFQRLIEKLRHLLAFRSKKRLQLIVGELVFR